MSKKTKNCKNWLFAIIMISILISSCGPGQFLGPTITPSPTFTLTPTITPSPTLTPTATATITPSPTPTPIPGIEQPVTVNGVGVRIQSAVVGGELPPGYRLTSGYDTVLKLEVEFSGNEEWGDLWDQMVVVDENGNESHSGLGQFSLDQSGEIVSHNIFFGVKKDSHNFSLRLPDGQIIDLGPVLETE